MGAIDDIFREVLRQHPDELADDMDDEELANIIVNSADRIVPILLESIKMHAPETLQLCQNDISDFLKHHSGRWQEGIDLLEILGGVCREIGASLNEEYRPIAVVENDCRFEVLIRFHARAGQIYSEIVCLLKNGFADGAMARWRALHEVAAVACLLAENDMSLSEKFLEHRLVEQWKSMRSYQAKCDELDQEPFSEEEMQEAKEASAVLISKYGKVFAGNYGWAFPLFQNTHISFADIEDRVGLSHLRPYYKWACQKIHAGPTTLYTGLSLMDREDMLLAGPSNAGLADPAHLSALSMAQANIVLASIGSSLDVMVGGKVVMLLCDEIGDVFMRLQQELETEESKLQEQSFLITESTDENQ